jgi:hypothetical protein
MSPCDWAVAAQQQRLRISDVPLTAIKGNPGQSTLPKMGNRRTTMTDNTELQRLTRLRRLAREIAASVQADLDREQAFQVHGSVRKLLEWQPPSSGT